MFSKYHFVKNPSTCTYCATFFLCINFQGSLGGDLRRGQHVAQAEVAQMCGGGRDADRVGTSHMGLEGEDFILLAPQLSGVHYIL